MDTIANLDPELYSRTFCALAIALVGSFVFMAVGRAWLAVGGSAQGRNPFPEHILFEPGHGVRQRLQKLDRKYYLYLSSLLVYLLLLVVAFALQREPLPYEVPDWVWPASSLLAIVTSLILPIQVVRLKMTRSRLALRRSGKIAMGHALQRIASRGYYVFHDVPVGKQLVDNVLVGPKGAYAVNVFVMGNGRVKNGTARLNGSTLVLGNAKTSAPIGSSVNRTSGLSKELSQAVGHPIRVRSVIAVPGWNVTSTDSDKHLLVNEKTVVMLTGWTDTDSYLMDEDVTKIQGHLTARCVNGKQTPG